MAIIPNKAMCRVDEAAKALDCTARHVQNLIAEKKLLAINVSGTPSGRRWKVVVRRDSILTPREFSNLYLTLEEFIRANRNTEF